MLFIRGRRLLSLFVPTNTSVGTQLSATINRGTVLFNPFRFSSVLTTISKEGRIQSDGINCSRDISMEFSKYLQAAIACFKYKSNIEIIGIVETCLILRLLSRDDTFTKFSSAELVCETITKSLMDLVKSSSDLQFVNWVSAISREGLLESLNLDLDTFRKRASKIKLARCRIRLVESSTIISESNIVSFLDQVVHSELDKLQQLSVFEISTLVRYFPKNDQLLDILELKLRDNSLSFGELIDVITNVRRGPIEVAQSLFTRYAGDLEVELLSIEQQVDVAWIGAQPFAKSAIANLVWRIERDSEFSVNIDTTHVCRLMEVCENLESYDSSVVLLRSAAMCQFKVATPEELCRLFQGMSRLPGNPWIEHPELAERILHAFITISPIGLSESSKMELWKNFAESVGVMDWSVVKCLATRLSRNESVLATFRSMIEANQQHGRSRLGNIVVARIMAISGESDSAYSKAVASLVEVGTIPINIKLSGLKPAQLMDLLERIKRLQCDQNLLHSLELVSDAILTTSSSLAVHEKMEFLRIFVNEFNYPPVPLVRTIGEDIASLSPNQFLEFVHLCALVRCSFEIEKVVEYIGLVDLRQIDGVRVVDLIEDLSSLGMLRQEGLVSRLITSFTSNNTLSQLSEEDRAKSSARLLSSLLISLIVPSDKHLSVLCDNIFGHVVDDFDKCVIREFADTVKIEKLQELVPGWNVYQISRMNVCDEISPSDTMFSPSEELTQLRKFKMFVHKQKDSKNLVSWISRM